MQCKKNYIPFLQVNFNFQSLFDIRQKVIKVFRYGKINEALSS